MSVARIIKSPVTQRKSVVALSAKMDSEFKELRTIMDKFSADTDRYCAKTAKGTVDYQTVVLDRIEREVRWLQATGIVLNAMYRDIARRLGPPSLLIKRS